MYFFLKSEDDFFVFRWCGGCGVCLRYLRCAIRVGIEYWAVLDNLVDCQNGQYWIMSFSEAGEAEYMY